MKILQSYYNSGQILLYPFALKMIPKVGLSLIRSSNRPTGLYDPFEQLGKSKKTEEFLPPYLEFARLNPDDPEELLAYANTNGIPVSPSMADVMDTFGEDKIQRIPQDRLFGNRLLKLFPRYTLLEEPYPIQKFAKEIGIMNGTLALKALTEEGYVPGLSAWFNKLQYLGNPTDTMDEFGELISISEVLRKTKQKRKTEEKFRRDAIVFLKGDLEEKLRGVCPLLEVRWDCLKTEKGSAEARIFERTYRYQLLRQALYLTLFEDIALTVRYCANAKCSSPFSANHKRTIYCCHQCGVNVARRKSYGKTKALQKKTKGS